MNGSPIAAIVRGWVDLYTRGLPADERAARRDEIDDDLWCEHAEAAGAGRSARSLDTDLALRLMLGIPSDISWRFAHRTGNPTETNLPVYPPGTVGLGWAAIVAGVGLIGLLLRFSEAVTADILIGTGMIAEFALAAVLVGLALGFEDRLTKPAIVGASVGGICAALATFGAWPLMFALPLCSAPLIWNLASARILGRWAAWWHAISAGAMLMLIVGLALGGRLQGQVPVVIGLALGVWFAYPMSWVLIGVSLIRRTAPPGRSVVAA
jgi:hypothetical protein